MILGTKGGACTNLRRISALVVVFSLFVLVGCCWFNSPPIASFTVPQDLRAKMEITFTNTSADPDGFEDLRSFIWDFGDGTPPSDAINASHTYMEPGRYIVKLTVIDSCGNVDSFELPIDVFNPVFGFPEEIAVGRTWARDEKMSAYIPDRSKYDYREDEDEWWVTYYYDRTTSRLIPENIVFLLRVPFSCKLQQPVRLRLHWRLIDQAGTELHTHVQGPILIGDLSKVAGVEPIWDLWYCTKYGAFFQPGEYETWLLLEDQLSEEVFTWKFTFRVLWGGL